MHTPHINAYINAHALILAKTERSTSLVGKEEKGWQYDKLMGGVKTICFTNCTLRERINRRTQSQGPRHTLILPPPKLRSGEILPVCRKSNWFDRWIVPPTILSNEWWRRMMMVPISLLPWISLEAVPKDFYGIPDYLGKYTSSSFSIGSKACQKVFKPGQIHGIARNLNVRIHKPQISAVMLFSKVPKCQ